MMTESGDNENRPFDHSQGKSYSYNHMGSGTLTDLKKPTRYSAHERATAAEIYIILNIRIYLRFG